MLVSTINMNLPVPNTAGSFSQLLFTLFLTAFIACDTSEVEPSDSRQGYDFFPLQIGQYAEYEVETFSYASDGSSTEQQFQLRESVADTFTDLSGEKAFRIERYYRIDSLASWQLDSIWTAKRTTTRAVRTENNISYVKLIFPVRENVSWDGNALNNVDTALARNNQYQITNLDEPFQVLGNSFERTLRVTQSNEDNLCGKDTKFEVFARGSGLVYKEQTVLSYSQPNSECDGTKEISFGTIVTQRLRSFGTE